MERRRGTRAEGHELSALRLRIWSSLSSYVASVEAAGDRGVGGAFDNGAAIGEKCHLVGLVPEFQDEVVVADHAMRLEAAVHLCEIDGALALMDLHRIPATERDVRSAFTG